MPNSDKQRLKEQARKAKRDASNLALEFLNVGMDVFDRKLAATNHGAINGQGT